MSTTRSRGLDAVARVRRVREKASLQGLHVLRAEADQTERRLAHLEGRLDAPLSAEGGTDAFLRMRSRLLALGELAGQARVDLDAATALALDARAHWEVDRSRLAAIELLRERHEDRRRAELARLEQQRLDEVAIQLWTRRTDRDREAAS